MMKIATKEWKGSMRIIPAYIVVISLVFALFGLVVAASLFLLVLLPILCVATGALQLITLGHIDLVSPLLRFAERVWDSLRSL